MARPPLHLEPGSIRETVLAVALHLFARRGYFNTSIPQLARAARVGVGSIYHHFRDKEDIARALYQGLTDGMTDELAAIAERCPTCAEQCRATIAMLFALTESHPEAMAFMLYAQHREFLPDEPPVCSSRPFAAMRAFVATGMTQGEIRRMDPMIAASALFGGALRLIAARLDGAVDRPLPELIDEVWDCGWRSIAAPGPKNAPSTPISKRAAA